MPRPRKNDPTALLRPIIEDFAMELGRTIERLTMKRIEFEITRALDIKIGNGSVKRTRARVLCYYPGCKNVAAPRFGMFCAALHKSLPKKHKAEIRAKRAA